MRSAPTQASVTAAGSVNLFARTHIPGRWPTRRPAGKGGALCSSTAKGNHRQCHDAQGALSANQSIQMVAEGRALTLTDPGPSLRRLYSTLPSVRLSVTPLANLPISQSPSVATPLLYHYSTEGTGHFRRILYRSLPAPGSLLGAILAPQASLSFPSSDY